MDNRGCVCRVGGVGDRRAVAERSRRVRLRVHERFGTAQKRLRRLSGEWVSGSGIAGSCVISIRNPGTFYFRNINNDWTAPQNDDLWQDEVKTLFDPCPIGWRVPQSGVESSGRNPWSAFTASNGLWQGSGAAAGRIWSSSVIYGGRAWYPSSPRRYYSSGNFQLRFCVITTALDSSVASSVLHFCYDGTSVLIAESHLCAHAHSVRCIRE